MIGRQNPPLIRDDSRQNPLRIAHTGLKHDTHASGMSDAQGRRDGDNHHLSRTVCVWLVRVLEELQGFDVIHA
jgi:hypothetical protein